MKQNVIQIGILFASFLLFYTQGSIGDILLRLLWLVVSNILLFLILKRIDLSRKMIFFSHLCFMLTPGLIEQSLRLSGVDLFLLLILLFILINLYIRNIFVYCLSLVTSVVLLRIVYPEFWIFKSFNIPSLNTYIVSLYKVLSFESLFFHNTSVDFRNSIGVFYPESVFLFIFGLIGLINKKNIQTIILLLVPWILIIFGQPEISAKKDFLVFLPFLAVVFSAGILFIVSTFERKSFVLKLPLYACVLILGYGILNFHHYFWSHFIPFIYASQ